MIRKAADCGKYIHTVSNISGLEALNFDKREEIPLLPEDTTYLFDTENEILQHKKDVMRIGAQLFICGVILLVVILAAKYATTSKGQLISECPFDFLNVPKKQ